MTEPKYIELIDRYLIKQNEGDYNPPSYEWVDNTGEIVRCADCKYQEKGENDCEAWNLCGFRPWLHYPVQDEHYCSYGEREYE